ncbi:hypothetical protein AVEN_104911-1, partial [Araneus ventricosus]
ANWYGAKALKGERQLRCLRHLTVAQNLRSQSQNSACVASKWDVNVTELNSFSPDEQTVNSQLSGIQVSGKLN